MPCQMLSGTKVQICCSLARDSVLLLARFFAHPAAAGPAPHKHCFASERCHHLEIPFCEQFKLSCCDII
jgi:hypothetical protein